MEKGYFSRKDHGGFDEDWLNEELRRVNNKIKNMQIKAKFICTSVTDFGDSKKIQMNPVIHGDGNLDYSRYTPSGNIELMITNPDAFNQFEPKEEYYITFEKAE